MKSRMRFIISVGLVLMCCTFAYGESIRRDEKAVAVSGLSMVSLSEMYLLDRLFAKFEPDSLDLASADWDGAVQYECHATFCRCEGENSPDCDLLFANCDLAGGLFSCASDFGFEFDVCDCEF